MKLENQSKSTMLKLLFCRLCSHLRHPKRRKSNPNKTTLTTTTTTTSSSASSSALVHPNNNTKPKAHKPIRVATFNAALFSMAPPVPTNRDEEQNARSDLKPKSILKQSPLHPVSSVPLPKSKLRVSINLPDNEISLLRSRQSSFSEHEREGGGGGGSSWRWRSVVMRQCNSFSGAVEGNNNNNDVYGIKSRKTVLEVLRELDADVLALQDVKADEQNDMKPLSDLAKALGMNYVFADSWAPEYGNAVLSRWPIKRSNVQKLFDHSDFRNVLKATIDVPEAGEMNFYCTHLDHLDENWRMKQINAIIQSNNDEPHILAGGLNSLDESDYSQERWTDIVKYYEEIGKPTPKVEVMKYLKSKHYTDAKDYSGECESVVMIAKGQSVQGTCKYGTRVDYILSSSDSTYKFVAGSYQVVSSKGTSDHHIVKVDVVKEDSIPKSNPHQEDNNNNNNVTKKQQRMKTQSSPSTCIWNKNTYRRDID
ncbi:hypothetical protein PIB30_039944 [Stylosanthes scabra]|uniref:Endonuclease/exonuclease/phosphatase domain-containing protein n=1 Tax=Stylosanthes scabra TaxID=79078 RepID=A0ABU6SFI3_9FABA|nr:hypothetical protein [Stylosanthes scabra]